MTKEKLVKLMASPLEQKIHERKGIVIKTEILHSEIYDGVVIRVTGQIQEQSVIPMKEWVEAGKP